MSQVSNGKQAIEIHDSRLERLELQGGVLVADVAAYVHRSLGRPGVSPGSGWSQTARLQLGSASHTAVALPIGLSGGQVALGATAYRNLIPVPLSHQGAVRIELQVSTGETILMSGDSLRVELVGTPEYIEEFPGQETS